MQQTDGQANQTKAAYVMPSVTVMNEEEVLRTFQVTSAMSTWWVPGGTPVA